MQEPEPSMSAARWMIAIVIVGGALWQFLEVMLPFPEPSVEPHNIDFRGWYGNWQAVLVISGIFTAFLFGFARPRGRGEWRNIVMYVWLARREDRELARRVDEAFLDYAARTPALFPWVTGRES